MGQMYEQRQVIAELGQVLLDLGKLGPDLVVVHGEQGIEGIGPYAGSVKKVMVQFTGGLRSSLGYCGARDIPTLRETGKIVRVSDAGVREAHPHDIKIMREAPNYRS